jgi:hypothetical protein
MPTSAAPETRLTDLERELRAVTARAHAAEYQVGQLAQLVAVVTELHAATDVADVLSTIKETIANLIGCEQMGIYQVDAAGLVLTLVDSIGIEPSTYRVIPPELPLVASALALGTPQFGRADAGAIGPLGRPITACIPLGEGPRTFGLIVLFSLLVQKPRLEAADHALLTFLGLHASRAMTRLSAAEPWSGSIA